MNLSPERGARTPRSAGSARGAGRSAQHGDVHATGHLFAHSAAHAGDVAEPVRGEGLAAGDVVELDGFDANGKLSVRKSASALSRRVAGVVSTDPSLRLAGLATDTPLAVTGIVPVRVVGPVAIGDLLVTSHVAGAATACPAGADCQGAIVGKAAERTQREFAMNRGGGTTNSPCRSRRPLLPNRAARARARSIRIYED